MKLLPGEEIPRPRYTTRIMKKKMENFRRFRVKEPSHSENISDESATSLVARVLIITQLAMLSIDYSIALTHS